MEAFNAGLLYLGQLNNKMLVRIARRAFASQLAPAAGAPASAYSVQDYDSFFQQGGALVNIEQLRGRAVSANLIQSRSARTTSITS